jgi:arabinose-5-phosphate isomerase
MFVKDVMMPLDLFPVILENVIFKEALEEMNHKKLGIACIVDQDKILKGIITDGDIRRKLLKIQKPLSAFFIDDCINHAIISPIVANSEFTLETAVEIMRNKQIWDLPVVDNNNKLIGLLHLHPVVEALLNKMSMI